MDIDLEHLTEAERDAILAVLNRDEMLRDKEQTRVRQLRSEVKQIRLKGVIKLGSDPNKTCARCRQPFGWLFNKGALCPQCQHRICETCECKLEEKGKWLCVLCFKQAELEAMSGQWFYSKFRKSKRNKKTNQVISGPDLVKASIRRRHSTGGESRGSSVTDDIKRALSNNNASPKSLRSSGSVEGESSDTQSMEGVSPSRRRGQIQDVSFPRDSDRRKLHDLMRTKEPASSSPQPPVNVLVKKVLSNRYDESDSSSDSSGPSSPQLSNRTESGIQCSDSVRSSVQSDAVSLQSSEGRITVVTETNISDIETMSHVSPQSSPYLGASRLTLDEVPLQDRKSSDSVIDDPSHFSQNDDANSTGFDAIDSAATVQRRHKTSSAQDPSKLSSSDSEEEYTTEQITKIKFRRVSLQAKPTSPTCPRTPSPPPDLKPRSRTGSSNDAQPSAEANSELAVTPVQSGDPICDFEPSSTLTQCPPGEGQTGGDTNLSPLHVEPCTPLVLQQPSYDVLSNDELVPNARTPGLTVEADDKDAIVPNGRTPSLTVEADDNDALDPNGRSPGLTVEADDNDALDPNGRSPGLTVEADDNDALVPNGRSPGLTVEADDNDALVPNGRTPGLTVEADEHGEIAPKNFSPTHESSPGETEHPGSVDASAKTLLFSNGSAKSSGDVRSKVGSLLAKYGRKSPTLEPSHIEKASDLGMDIKTEHYNVEDTVLTSQGHHTSHPNASISDHESLVSPIDTGDVTVREFGEFLADRVVHDAMASIDHEGSSDRKLLIWSDSLSDSELPPSDMDDLEWDGDLLGPRKDEQDGLFQEIKTALASSLPGIDLDQGRSSPIRDSSPSYRRSDDTRADFLDDEEEDTPGSYQYRSYIGPQSSDSKRFRRMVGADEASSDTLSVITEHTEPEGSDSDLDSISDLEEDSDFEDGGLGKRNSSVINLLDSGTDEDTTLGEKPESVQAEIKLEVGKTSGDKSSEGIEQTGRRIPKLSKSEDYSSSVSLDTDTDPALSNSQTLSEISDTESAQDMNAPDSPTKSRIIDRRDTITMLAEEANVDDILDFTIIYEHNKGYAEESDSFLDSIKSSPNAGDIVVMATIVEPTKIEKLETVALHVSEHKVVKPHDNITYSVPIKQDSFPEDEPNSEIDSPLSVADLVKQKNIELESPVNQMSEDKSLPVVHRVEELQQVQTRKLKRRASKEHQGPRLDVSIEESPVDERHTSSVTNLRKMFDHPPPYMNLNAKQSGRKVEEETERDGVMAYRSVDPKGEALVQEVKRLQNKSPSKLSMSAEDLPPNTPVSDAIADTLARSLEDDDDDYDIDEKLPGKRLADDESESASKHKAARWNPCPTPEPLDKPEVALVTVGSKRKHDLLPSSSSSSDSEDKGEDQYKYGTTDNSGEITFSIFQQGYIGGVTNEDAYLSYERDFKEELLDQSSDHDTRAYDPDQRNSDHDHSDKIVPCLMVRENTTGHRYMVVKSNQGKMVKNPAALGVCRKEWPHAGGGS